VSSAWQTHQSSGDDCEDCNREEDNKKEAFIKSMDLDSFLQLKAQINTTKKSKSSPFADVIFSPKRKESERSSSFSHEEESSIVELMNVLRDKSSPSRTVSREDSRDNTHSGSVDELLTQLLREELQDRDDAMLERLLAKDASLSTPRARRSKIPKYVSKTDDSKLSQSLGSRDSANVRNDGSEDSGGYPLVGSEEKEEFIEKPRKRSVSPSILNLLLPVERHQCQYCSPPKKVTDATRSESPPWNHSTKLDTKQLLQPTPSSQQLKPTTFFRNPQPKKPFVAGILKSASPARIPHRLSPTPSKIPKSTRQRRSESLSSRSDIKEDKKKGEYTWVTNNDVMDLLDSYHHNNGNENDRNGNSNSNSDSAFRLREDFSAELERGPPPGETPVVLNSSMLVASSPGRRAQQPSTVVYSPNRAPLPSHSSNSPQRQSRHDDYADEVYESLIAMQQQVSPPRPGIAVELATKPTLTVSPSSLTNAVSSEVRTNVYSSGTLVPPRPEVPVMTTLEEEERFYTDVDPDSLHTVIKEFSVQEEVKRKRDSFSSQYQKMEARGEFDAASKKGVTSFNFNSTHTEKVVDQEARTDMLDVSSARKETAVSNIGNNGGGGDGDSDGDEMGRYMTWLSHQSSTSPTDDEDGATDHASAANTDTELPPSHSHSTSQFESNLSAWRHSNRNEDSGEEKIHQSPVIRSTQPEVQSSQEDNDDVYSDDFDPEWKEDAKIIAERLGLTSSHGSDSSPFAALRSPPNQSGRGVGSSSEVKASPSTEELSEIPTRPPQTGGLSVATPDAKDKVAASTPAFPSSHSKRGKLAAPYGTPQSLAKSYPLSLGGLDDDYTDCSGSTHSPLPLASVRHPRLAALTPSQCEPPDTPPSALFTSATPHRKLD